jgi:hypothetical protein
MWFSGDGAETIYLVEGQVPTELIQGWGQTRDEAIADFWDNAHAEALQAAERDADPDQPLTERQVQALRLFGKEPTERV